MERLCPSKEALACLKRYRVCVIELPHDEVAQNELYFVQVISTEGWVVKVNGVQESPSGDRSHIRLAICSFEKVCE